MMWALTEAKYFVTMTRNCSWVSGGQRGSSIDCACGVIPSFDSSTVRSTGFLTFVCFTPRTSYEKFLVNATRRGRLT